MHARDLNFFADNDSVHPYDDERYRSVELGASKHYEVDWNLARAAKEFNLTRIARKQRDDGVGIWDGSEILFRVSFHIVLSVNIAQGSQLGGGPFPVWDRLKTYWTYGFWSLSASDTM